MPNNGNALQNFNQSTYWVDLQGNKVPIEKLSKNDILRALHALWMLTRSRPKMAWVSQSLLYGALINRGRTLINDRSGSALP